MTCLINVDHDDTYQELSCKIVKARKPHRCGECRDFILPGEKYERFIGALDGVDTHRTCLVCLSIRDKLCCNWTYTGMFDDIYDAVTEDPRLEDCILMQLNRDEYLKIVRFLSFLDDEID